MKNFCDGNKKVKNRKSKMGGLFFLFPILYFSFFIFLVSADEWQELKGNHFLVYYLEDKKFAKVVLRQAERYYDRIADDLGYSRYDKFWQWENRVKIYIYQNHKDFLNATGKPKWVLGMARYNQKEVISYRWNKGFLDSLLPHELTHLVFRDFVGFTGEIPLWLDEGIAQWEEEEKRKTAVKIVKGLIRDGSFIHLSDLMHTDVRKENDFELSRKFYAQAVSLVGYMVKQYGGSKFTLFCRQLRDGQSINEALSSTYPTSIRNVEGLERKWIEYYERGE